MYKETIADIGQRLIDLRKKKGYTSSESFALEHELPRVQYWRIEKGKANLTFKSLIKILQIHNLTFEEFFCFVREEAVVGDQ